MAITNSMLKEAKLKTDLLIACNDPLFITSEACFHIRDLCSYLKDNFNNAENYKRILFIALLDNGIDLDKCPADVISFIDDTGVLSLDTVEVDKLRKISAVFF